MIDAVNGAGANALPDLLESLGCDVVELYCEPNGDFKRGTEPLPQNLIDLSNEVIKNKADAGFAIDEGDHPIVPVMLGDANLAQSFNNLRIIS